MIVVPNTAPSLGLSLTPMGLVLWVSSIEANEAFFSVDMYRIALQISLKAASEECYFLLYWSISLPAIIHHEYVFYCGMWLFTLYG